VAFLFSGIRIVVLDLLIPRVPVGISVGAEAGCTPRPFITSLDIFFVRRRILPAVLLGL
jgi:hypothetical protein